MNPFEPSTAAFSTIVSVAAIRSVWAAHRRAATRRRIVGGTPPRSEERVDRSRRTTDANAELLELLGLIARNVEAGASLSLAINESLAVAAGGPVHAGLRSVAEQAPQIGLVGALRRWGADNRECRRTAWALAVAAETGGDPLAAIDALTDSLRSERALARELGALTAQSRLSAAVLGMVPIGFGLLMSGTDPLARQFLFASSQGRVCLLVGLGLDALAWRWLRSLGTVTA